MAIDPGAIKKFAEESDYDILVNETAQILKPDGSHLVTLVKKALSVEELKNPWAAIRDWKPETDNRGTSTGVKGIFRKKQDGTISNTRRVPRGEKVVSGVLGYYDRYARTPYCRKCAWNEQHPAGWNDMLPLFAKVSETHKQYMPDFYLKQKEIYDKTNADFKIPDSIYTSVTVNKNYRTAYHLDGKNMAEGVSAMLLIREGKIKGGYVVFPEYRVAAAMDSGDIVFFDGQAEVHGNTNITPLTSNSVRCTLVHYFRGGMIYCGSMEDELERAKRRPAGSTLQKENLNENN